MTVTHLAALVVHLPPGAMVWRSSGGPYAWTDDMYLLAGIENAVRVVAWQKTKAGHDNRDAPKLIEPPKSEFERQAEIARLEKKARRFLHRQARIARET